jgi:hypothetical protein
VRRSCAVYFPAKLLIKIIEASVIVVYSRTQESGLSICAVKSALLPLAIICYGATASPKPLVTSKKDTRRCRKAELHAKKAWLIHIAYPCSRRRLHPRRALLICAYKLVEYFRILPCERCIRCCFGVSFMGYPTHSLYRSFHLIMMLLNTHLARIGLLASIIQHTISQSLDSLKVEPRSLDDIYAAAKSEGQPLKVFFGGSCQSTTLPGEAI